MIIQCEKCHTKFNFDESLLKKEGVKVRCSVCKHIFLASPPEQGLGVSDETADFSLQELEKTVALDSSVVQEEATGAEPKNQGIDFDNLFDESMKDIDELEAMLPEEPLPVSEEEETDIEKPEPAGEEEVEEPTSVDLEEKEDSIESEKPVTPPEPEKREKSRILLVIFIIILMAVSAGIYIFFRAPQLIPSFLSFLKPAERQAATDIGVKRLDFKAVTGSFVKSEHSGRFFVIQGLVKNNYPKSRSYILIKGTILDNKQNVIMKKLVYAGNMLSKEEIQTMSLDEINKSMKNRNGKDDKNINVAAGTIIPFTIVFSNLEDPENLGEFTVEAVSSSIGAK